MLIRPEDLIRVKEAMTAAGFYFRETAGLSMFVETEDAPARDAVHLVLAGEMIRAADPEPNPDVEPSEKVDSFRTLSLERLVRMKLNSFRLKDRVHIVDMIDVGLVDESWLEKYPAEISQRLKRLIDDPDG